jgi:hypothetical protein
MPIQCRAGGTKHNHDTVEQVKAHFVVINGGVSQKIDSSPWDVKQQETVWCETHDGAHLATAYCKHPHFTGNNLATRLPSSPTREERNPYAQELADLQQAAWRWSAATQRAGIAVLEQPQHFVPTSVEYEAANPRPAEPARPDWSEVRRLQRLLPDQAHAYYAVELADGKLHFFRIDKPQEGRWAGRTFLKEQASDEFWPVKGLARTEEVLQAITADYRAAMTRYGQEIGRCGHCHRTLTDEESRARGIGPVCYAKMGW